MAPKELDVTQEKHELNMQILDLWHKLYPTDLDYMKEDRGELVMKDEVELVLSNIRMRHDEHAKLFIEFKDKYNAIKALIVNRHEH